MVVVDEISYIIDQMRETGTATIVSGATSDTIPCKVVWDCDPCLKISDLSDGVHSWYDKSPYYYYGNKPEVAKLLTIKDNSITNRAKYPCIILEQPFIEVPDREITKVTLRLLLATKTDSTMTYKKRYETNFKTILYPMYEDLMTAIKASNNVQTYVIKSKTDIPFYTDKEVVSNDFWDVIDLRLELNLINNCKKNLLCQQ